MRTRNSIAEQKEAELHSWLDHKVFDFVNKKAADKDRVMRSMGTDVEAHRQS